MVNKTFVKYEAVTLGFKPTCSIDLLMAQKRHWMSLSSVWSWEHKLNILTLIKGNIIIYYKISPLTVRNYPFSQGHFLSNLMRE